ncbi:GNAT family N-acetyltransferase [Paenibacillus aceris]|uniref:Ribosomal protein S18 acetylase RimI-like enzyme n=1 Tax=Paenibacillus aceris TaxID=869555 RepID=A0ABS4HZF3_9BACL|nr:GNAT family N-acetyltransferase [Paenibacillus aceris]MBP1964032.1 ribosomal protein S18 acetylase RimI-like enzyme [Paenibacillus aceris]NHW34553.1 GNAT family N-acetyltransferase [Paenibacillus aceris]
MDVNSHKFYAKKLYVFDGDKPIEAVIRNYEKADFDALIRVQQESFPPPFPSELWWNEEQLTEHVTRFPQGALCVEVAGKIVGSITGLLVDYEEEHASDHSWSTLTDDGYIRTHQPDGDTLYIVDICVMPAYRKFGLGKWLMQSMYEVVVHLGLRRLLGGGRMPGYHKHAGTMSAEDYVKAVMAGTYKDPVLTFLLRCGRTPVQVVPDYLQDEESQNYGLLMEWRNPFRILT